MEEEGKAIQTDFQSIQPQKTPNRNLLSKSGHGALWAHKIWCLPSINKKKKDTKVQSVVITFDVLKGWRQKGSFIPKQQPTVQRVLSTGCSAVSELNQAITFMAPQTHSCNFSRFDYVAGFSCFSSGLFLKCQPTLMCHAPETETKYCWIKKCTVRKVPSSLIISCWRRLFKK